jgi:MFS family permease
MTSAHTQAPAQHSWAPLLTIASGVFLVALDGTITAVANPVLAVELKATLGGLQWVTSAYLLALAGVLVLAGRLGDRWGRKTTFQIGVAGFALSSVGIAASPTIEAVIAARVGQGVFGALIVTNALSLLRTSYSGARLATALATFGTVIGAASATGPLIGGLLVDGVGWRWAFLINAPVGALSLIAAHRYVSGPLPERGKRLDVLGAVVLMSALICLTYGIIHAGETTWASATVVTTLVAGVLLTLTFALVERGQAGALVPLRLFRDRNVVIGVVLGFVSFFSLVGALFFSPTWLAPPWRAM